MKSLALEEDQTKLSRVSVENEASALNMQVTIDELVERISILEDKVSELDSARHLIDNIPIHLRALANIEAGAIGPGVPTTLQRYEVTKD